MWEQLNARGRGVALIALGIVVPILTLFAAGVTNGDLVFMGMQAELVGLVIGVLCVGLGIREIVKGDEA